MLGNKAKAIILSSLLALAGMLPLHANADCAFVSTKDGSPLTIKAVDDDTPEAKEFLKTCVNPYTKKFVADADAAKAGKKLFGFWYAHNVTVVTLAAKQAQVLLTRHGNTLSTSPTKVCSKRSLAAQMLVCQHGTTKQLATQSC